MIIFKELRWSNAFSYGKDNRIVFDQAPLTQLVGKNGHGKSSIALILEECLFNTNSKKIKKADVLNRHTKDKNYTIEVDFDKDGDSYTVSTKRTSASGTVVLLKNGDDISSHTATGTYKQIEYILGYDHKTFAQIVYQSSVSSLEFLTATDTARKKFLIELLNLTQYTKANEVFKEIASDKSKRLEVIKGKVDTINAWLAKYDKEDLTPVPLVEEPEPPTELNNKLSKLEAKLSTIDATNKRIAQNNKYKELRDAIELETWQTKIPNREDQYNGWMLEVRAINKELEEGATLAKKCKGPTTKCPTCSQDVDNTVMYNMHTTFQSKRPELEARAQELNKLCLVFQEIEAQYKQYLTKVAEYEKYHSLYDPSMETELGDKDLLVKEIFDVKADISLVNKGIQVAKDHNTKATAKNSKIAVIASQKEEMHSDLSVHTKELVELTEELSDLQILVKAFSTTGLVAYKIECLVKDLEDITNKYLAVLAGGRFQLSFQIAASDKLNVVISDNGRDITIDALSSGERARVNVATLLAIRKLMQSLSNSRSNLLILDETIENLDAEGKEKLVEVLLEETSLNTFLISHGFSHPLLEKLHVVKENNVSRIDS